MTIRNTALESFAIKDFWKPREVKLGNATLNESPAEPTLEQRFRENILGVSDLVGNRITESKAFRELEESFKQYFIRYEADSSHKFSSLVAAVLFQETSKILNGKIGEEEFTTLHNQSLKNFLADIYRRVFKFSELHREELNSPKSYNKLSETIVKNLSGVLENGSETIFKNYPRALMHIFYESFIQALKLSEAHKLKPSETEHLLRDRLDRIQPISEYISRIDESEAPIREIKQKYLLNMLITRNSALEYLDKQPEIFNNISQKLDEAFSQNSQNQDIYALYKVYRERDDYINFKKDMAKVYLHFATQTTNDQDPLTQTLKVGRKFTELYSSLEKLSELNKKSLRSSILSFLSHENLNSTNNELLQGFLESEEFKEKNRLKEFKNNQPETDGFLVYARQLQAMSIEEREKLALKQAAKALINFNSGLGFEQQRYPELYLKTLIETSNLNREKALAALEKDSVYNPELRIVGEQQAMVLSIMKAQHPLAQELSPQILAAKIPDNFIQRLEDAKLANQMLYFNERLNNYAPKISIPFPQEADPRLGVIYDVRNDRELMAAMKKYNFLFPRADDNGKFSGFYQRQGRDEDFINTVNASLVLMTLLYTLTDKKLDSLLSEGILKDSLEAEKAFNEKKKFGKHDDKSFLVDFFSIMNDIDKKFIPNFFVLNQAFKQALLNPEKLNILEGKNINYNSLIFLLIRTLLVHDKTEIYKKNHIPLEYADGKTRDIKTHDKEAEAFLEGTFSYYQKKINTYTYDDIKDLLSEMIKTISVSRFTEEADLLFPKKGQVKYFLKEDELPEFKMIALKYLKAAENGDFYSEKIRDGAEKNIRDFISDYLKTDKGSGENTTHDYTESSAINKVKRYITVAKILLAYEVKKDGLVN